jgi:hypothetical protein
MFIGKLDIEVLFHLGHEHRPGGGTVQAIKALAAGYNLNIGTVMDIDRAVFESRYAASFGFIHPHGLSVPHDLVAVLVFFFHVDPPRKASSLAPKCVCLN